MRRVWTSPTSDLGFIMPRASSRRVKRQQAAALQKRRPLHCRHPRPAHSSSRSSSYLSPRQGDKCAALYRLRSLNPGGQDKVRRSNHRRKVSTTISAESYEFLRRLMESGRAASLVGAVDQVVMRTAKRESVTPGTGDRCLLCPPFACGGPRGKKAGAGFGAIGGRGWF
jgi:hypothetical protein